MPKFIHLTDTHILPPGLALYGSDPAWRLRQAIDSINSEHGDAAFCVVTGDLTHYGQPEAYAVLREALARLDLPVHLLLGNHDSRANFVEAFPATPRDGEGFIQSTLQIGGTTAIFLDTNEPGVSWGVFCERRAAWLNATLAATAPDPVLLLQHHPPFPVGLPAMDRISLNDRGPFEAAIAGHRHRIRHLFFGHLHRPIAGSWRGIPFSTMRGTNHQVALDLAAADHVPGSMEPPQYSVVLLDDDRIVVHLHDFLDRSDRFRL